MRLFRAIKSVSHSERCLEPGFVIRPFRFDKLPYKHTMLIPRARRQDDTAGEPFQLLGRLSEQSILADHRGGNASEPAKYKRTRTNDYANFPNAHLEHVDSKSQSILLKHTNISVH